MEHPKQRGSNALSTGQVLYALKQAGVSVHAPFFTRGVAYLMDTQVHDTPTPANGSWKATNTDSNRPSDFAHTMWAVIGLAGSYGATKTGSLTSRHETAAGGAVAAAGAQPRGRARRVRLDEREAGRLDAMEDRARRARPAAQVAARRFRRRPARRTDIALDRAIRRRAPTRSSSFRSPSSIASAFSRRRTSCGHAARRRSSIPSCRPSAISRRGERGLGHPDHRRRGKLQGRSQDSRADAQGRRPSTSRSTSSASRCRARRLRSSSAAWPRRPAAGFTARRTAASSRAR